MAILNDLIVHGVARFANTIKAVAERAIGDGSGNNISNTYIKNAETIPATKSSSISTATAGNWNAMCNSTSTGSPVLPTNGQWWNVISLDNWNGAPTNYVSQLALPTQSGPTNIYYRRNTSSGTNIDSSVWHKVANTSELNSAAISALSDIATWSFSITSSSTSVNFTIKILSNHIHLMQWNSSNFTTSAYSGSMPSGFPSGYTWKPTKDVYTVGMNGNYNSTATSNNFKTRALYFYVNGSIYIGPSSSAGFWGSCCYI